MRITEELLGGLDVGITMQDDNTISSITFQAKVRPFTLTLAPNANTELVCAGCESGCLIYGSAIYMKIYLIESGVVDWQLDGVRGSRDCNPFSRGHEVCSYFN